jgi:hypothetical protein
VPVLSGVAQAATTASIDNHQIPTQNNWFYCGGCFCLFHSPSGGGDAGFCNVFFGSGHRSVTGGANYLLGFGVATFSHISGQSVAQGGVQEGWLFCGFWGSAQSASRCPNAADSPDGKHAAPHGSSNYDMIIQPVTFTAGPFLSLQAGWRYCGKCRAQFFGHGGNIDGSCPDHSDGFLEHVVLQGSAPTDYSMMVSP